MACLGSRRILFVDVILFLSDLVLKPQASFAAMKKGFLLNSTDAKAPKHREQQSSASSGSDVKAEDQKHQEVQQSGSAVEQRYTQAEINHFIARLETMRALGLDSYMTETGTLFDQKELDQISRHYGRK